MSIWRALTEKPWLVTGADVDTRADIGVLRRPAMAATGVWAYVAVASVMFLLVIAAYVLRLGNYGASPEQAAAASSSLAWWSLARLCGIPPASDWQPLSEPWLLWANTGVLILNSVAWQTARRDLRLGRMDRLNVSLTVSGALAFLFLLGQLAVWRLLIGGGQIATASPANAFFYMITAMHGLHLLGGLIFWGRTTSQAMNGAAPADVASGVNLCAVYWHFLLFIWVVLFGLMLIT